MTQGPLVEFFPEAGFAYYYPIGGFDNSQLYGRTSYLGNSGYLGNPDGDLFRQGKLGVFYNRSKVRFAEMVDGTSNSLMFGETIGSMTDSVRGSGPKLFNWTWNSGPQVSEYHRPGYTNTYGQLHGQFIWYLYSTPHTGKIWNYCKGDGAVSSANFATTGQWLCDMSAVDDGFNATNFE